MGVELLWFTVFISLVAATEDREDLFQLLVRGAVYHGEEGMTVGTGGSWMYHICSKEAERAKLPALFFIQFGGPIQLATFRVGLPSPVKPF